MDPLRRAYAQLHDRFRSMTPGSRLMAIMLAVALLVGLGYLAVQQSVRPEVDLMHGVPVAKSRLPLMEAAFGKAKLKDYVIRGSSIYVPGGQEAKYMEALVAAGALPPDLDAGLRESFNSSSLFEIGSSREQERMRIAKQHAVASAIKLRPGIEDASVLYDVSKPGGFKEKVATAIAYVKPVGSAQLDEAMVIDIRNDVVGAYAELKPEDVTVSDLNGRTWRGSVGSANEIRYGSLKRTCEQELKAKILGALGHLPNVSVELNVEFDRAALAPTSARVAIGVPTSYFRSVWRERNPSQPGQPENAPDAAALDRIRGEESANIRQCVATLLPRVNGAASQANGVTVTAYQEITATPPAAAAWHWIAWNWTVQSWRILAAFGLALVCLVVLRWMLGSRRAEADEPATTVVSAPPADKSSAKTAAPPPHWRHDAAPVERSLRQELSQLVEADPETAANILRNWIGQTS
jgi:flagellar biosynthesis/type III secretory pathway M-ring protein FliF/YscJ